MPDWTEIVKTRLGLLGLPADREVEIIREVAAHLEETYDNFRRQGCSEEEAVTAVLASASDWSELRQRIRFAEEGEGTMNQRIRSFWLPGLCAAAIAYVLLQLSGLAYPRLVAHTTNLKILAVFLGAMYLIGLVATGGGAAYLSRRMGGGTRHQLLGALLPAGMWVVLALICLAILPQVKIAYPQMKFDLLPLALLLATGIIALPLLVGALLVILHSRWSNRFHRDSQSGSVESKQRPTAAGPFKRWMHRLSLSHA